MSLEVHPSFPLRLALRKRRDAVTLFIIAWVCMGLYGVAMLGA